MVTDETIKLAKNNLDRKKANDYFSNRLHFKSFIIGLAVGLVICGAVLITAL